MNLHIRLTISCEIGELFLIERLNVGDMLKGAWGCKWGVGGEIVTLSQKARCIKFFYVGEEYGL